MTYSEISIQYIPLEYSNKAAAYIEKKRSRSLLFIFWVVVMVLCCSLYLIDGFGLTFYRSVDSFLSNNLTDLYRSNEVLKGYSINTPGCKIPEMNPFDSTVKQFISKPPKLVCNKGTPPLFGSTNTSIYVLNNSLPYYNISTFNEMSCCYYVIQRNNPTNNQHDKIISYSRNCTLINATTVAINDEFVTVVCKKTKEIYRDFFAFAPLKKKEIKSTSNKLKPNVLIIGLDAVSRVNLHRQMPRTLAYITEKLGAVELMGYNKVADNTFVNLIPVLTGQFEQEMKNSCWPKTNSRFDNCSFLWDDFRNSGYLTAFGEDCSWMGMFNYGKKGFMQQPVDYYYSSYEWVAEDNIGNNKNFNCKLCVGGKPVYQATLDYATKLVSRTEHESQPFFGFFWSVSLSHDHLNYPALGDNAHYQFFDSLNRNGYLNNTILVFMSDHGIRWGEIRQTYQGQLEERLPFVFIALPEHIKKDYTQAVANLKKNTRRLTTPFDLHETLKSFANIENLSKIEGSVDIRRGYSLFTEIPPNRTCENAQIPSHWCTCQQSIEVSTNNTNVISAASFAVDYMNQQLIGYAQCAPLVLETVLAARALYHEKEKIKDSNALIDYTVILRTIPGNGTFETTIRIKPNSIRISKGKKITNKSYSITGTVSRLNLYGKQSLCIADFHLKLYCYCKSLLKIS